MPPRRLKKARIAMTLPHLAPATNQRVAGRESDHPAEFERPARHPNLAVVRLILQSRRASIPIAAATTGLPMLFSVDAQRHPELGRASSRARLCQSDRISAVGTTINK